MEFTKDTVVVVTGANRAKGIGFALVQDLLKRGCGTVVATYHDRVYSDALLELAERDERVFAQPLDLTSAESAAALGDFCQANLKKIDLLINNAGIAGTRANSIIEAPIEEFENKLQVHAVGPLRVTQVLWPLLEKSGRPIIVNVSSTGGRMGNISRSYLFYGPAKAAQNALSIQMASNLADRAIILPIHPGWVLTDMGGENAPILPEQSAQGILDYVAKAGEAESGKFVDFTGKELSWL